MRTVKPKFKNCKHEWYYSTTVTFGKVERPDHYRTIHHCKKCGVLDIQTIYR